LQNPKRKCSPQDDTSETSTSIAAILMGEPFLLDC
jgi:hypothetical protein